MKLGIITINNGRPKIFHLWCASIRRLRSFLGDLPVVCVSGEEDAPLCEQYGIYHITQTNHPSSEKWNTAMSYMQTLDVDYVMISGSDDILSTQALANIIVATNSASDMIGFNSIYIYCASGKSKGKLKHITTKGVFGVGKTLSRGVLDATKWQPWRYSTPRSWGTDAILARNTAQFIKNRIMVEGTIVDVKTDESLNKFSMFERNKHGNEVSNALFYEIMGEEERRILADIEGRTPSLDHWLNTNTRSNLL